MRFGLGSTLAFRRRDLQAIGGFEAIVDYLADDYQLGSRIAALGLNVELSDVVVETFLPRYTLSDFIAHQLRWARTIRDSRFWGYVGLGLTFGVPWAAAGIDFRSRSNLGLGIIGMYCSDAHDGSGRGWEVVLNDRQVLRSLALIPLRDLVALLVWIVSFAGHEIVWRGDRFRLENGKLKRSQCRRGRSRPSEPIRT